MNNWTKGSVVILAAVLVFAGGCRRHEKTGDAATETIAPAAPQPEPTGTDAMTQTVDIEDSRSEAEGGALMDTAHTTTTATTATATTATTTAAAPPPPTTTTR